MYQAGVAARWSAKKNREPQISNFKSEAFGSQIMMKTYWPFLDIKKKRFQI